MSRCLRMVGLLLVAGAATAGAETEVVALIREGVRLHDAGRYDEAIAEYRKALALEPGNVEAIYEIAYAQFAARDFPACVATATPILDGAGRLDPAVYTILANCHDLAGDARKALRLFAKGMKKFPGDAGLAFNAGVTQGRRNDWPKAREMFQRAIDNDPRHRSAHMYLGASYRVEGYRVQGILAFLRFLALEPEGPRARGAADEVLGLLGMGFSKTGEAEYLIQLDFDQKTDEGEYSTADLVRALGGSVVTTEEWKDRSEGEKLVYQVDSVVAAVDEGKPARRPDFARRTYMPFLRALRERGLLEALVYRSFAPIGPPEFEEWVEQHPEKIEELERFVEAQ